MKKIGTGSVEFVKKITIAGHSCVVGQKEEEGPLGGLFDYVTEDDLFGEKNWEAAESALQKKALQLLAEKTKCNLQEVDFMCAGDLLGQSMATSYGAGSFGIPLFGLFGACSTCGEALLLSAMLLAGGYGTTAVSVTSSHYASAEKEFRYPLEYGNQKPLSSGWTVTGSGAFLLSSEMTKQGGITIAGGTLGRVVDFGCKDAMNMGACMAPAAADVLERHFKDFGRSPKDYDRIFTGDLGNVGSTILKEMMAEKGFSLDRKHDDCGSMIYEQKEQDTNNGGSGPGCAAVVLAAEILPRMVRGEWKRVLFIPTGALLSKTGYNEGQTIPAIAHAVLLEA